MRGLSLTLRALRSREIGGDAAGGLIGGKTVAILVFPDRDVRRGQIRQDVAPAMAAKLEGGIGTQTSSQIST